MKVVLIITISEVARNDVIPAACDDINYEPVQ